MGLEMYLSGLPLCNVPEGHDGISMDPHGQQCGSSAVDGQSLRDQLDAGRMASVTQNFEIQGDVLDFLAVKSFFQTQVDRLLAEMRNVKLPLLMQEWNAQKTLRLRSEMEGCNTITMSGGQSLFAAQYFETMVP